ncbi:MAG: hypothetical protein WDZ59_10865 [Pirellulales bacterium]
MRIPLLYAGLRRYFLATHLLAVVLATLAAAGNLIVGPTNLWLWVVPLFLLIVGTIILVFADAFFREDDEPAAENWMARRLLGDRFLACLRRIHLAWGRFVITYLMILLPLLSLTMAVTLLYFSITGEINTD